MKKKRMIFYAAHEERSKTTIRKPKEKVKRTVKPNNSGNA